MEKAQREGLGAVSLDGKLVDIASIKQVGKWPAQSPFDTYFILFWVGNTALALKNSCQTGSKAQDFHGSAS